MRLDGHNANLSVGYGEWHPSSTVLDIKDTNLKQIFTNLKFMLVKDSIKLFPVKLTASNLYPYRGPVVIPAHSSVLTLEAKHLYVTPQNLPTEAR